MRPVTTRSNALRLAGTAGIAACVALLGACTSDKGGKDDQAESPLEAFFSDVYGGWDEAEQNAKQLKVEEAVARCMTAEGFEYTPVDYSTTGSIEAAEIDFTSREYTEQHGYGILNQDDASFEAPEEDNLVDPNGEYIASLSESEQTAYFEALYGGSEFEVDEEPTLADQGCYGAAQLEVHGAEQEEVFESEEIQAFSDDMDVLQSTIENDPRVSDVNAAWASCMADAGFGGYATPQDAMDDFFERSNALWENVDPESTEAPTPSEADKKAERDTALADFDCKEKVKYEATERTVRFEHEKEYVDTHQAELAAVKDAFQKAGW
ncbi:hypothetical protein [Xylanimonas ulmi]|uniref:Uncharacterized protein n=1 Tax=Xylanimonas ulmi TaxID=228973 RepID=A0A4Q7M6D7_9MICO|nr:hypothetical protein [Xylanibacterium ulmi]RZS63244.1 hypothetical protein EV386_3607 [Xylanibacterium ulmi]